MPSTQPGLDRIRLLLLQYISFTFHWRFQVQDLNLIDGFTDKMVTTFLKVRAVIFLIWQKKKSSDKTNWQIDGRLQSS